MTKHPCARSLMFVAAASLIAVLGSSFAAAQPSNGSAASSSSTGSAGAGSMGTGTSSGTGGSGSITSGTIGSGGSWAAISGTATILSILKPILAPGKHLELCTRQHQGWYSLFFAAEKMMRNVKLTGTFSPENVKELDTLSERMVSLHLEDEKCR